MERTRQHGGLTLGPEDQVSYAVNSPGTFHPSLLTYPKQLSLCIKICLSLFHERECNHGRLNGKQDFSHYVSIPHMIKLALGPSKYKLQRLLPALDLSNKVKGVNSRITPVAAKDRW